MSLLEVTNSGSCVNGTMGLSHGLQLDSLNPKKTDRWLFSIPGFVLGSAPALPPKKAARPAIQLKEYEFQHLHESIWFPLKGEWKPINITLYDVRCNSNIMFDWLANIYNTSRVNDDEVKFDTALGTGFGSQIPQTGIVASIQPPTIQPRFKVPKCTLELYSGCGDVLETWIYENAYPNDINWGELDMGSSELVVVNFNLRYDRAWFLHLDDN